MNHGDSIGIQAGQSIDRRRLLQAGMLSCLGLGPTSSLAARTPAGRPRSLYPIRSCIVLFYYGGPSHLDTWDMKPTAPAEVRGEFRPIATRVPGIHISEHLPRCARIADKLAILRGMHHTMRNHNSAAVEALCGRTPLKGDLELLADDPASFACHGATLSFARPGRRGVPAHVALPHVMYNVVRLPGQGAGFLGAAYNPFQVNRDPNEPGFRIDELELPGNLPLARLEDRRSLLALVDARMRRAERLANRGAMTARQICASYGLRLTASACRYPI